jgi:hypothetical protein
MINKSEEHLSVFSCAIPLTSLEVDKISQLKEGDIFELHGAEYIYYGSTNERTEWVK